MATNDEDKGLYAALWGIALTGAALTSMSPFVLGRDGVLGVALGSALAGFNLWALARIVRAFMNGAGLPWAILAGLKLFGLLAVVAVLLKLGITTVVPLAVGYCAMPVGIVIAQLAVAHPRAATSPPAQGGVEDDSSPKGR